MSNGAGGGSPSVGCWATQIISGGHILGGSREPMGLGRLWGMESPGGGRGLGMIPRSQPGNYPRSM